jgi:hypothetical protein
MGAIWADVWIADVCSLRLDIRSTHMAPFYTEYPFPKELFTKFITENEGAGCVYIRVPVR